MTSLPISAEERRVKRCPFCAEDILEEAIVCKHCGRDLASRPMTLPANHLRVPILLTMAVIMVVFFFASVWPSDTMVLDSVVDFTHRLGLTCYYYDLECPPGTGDNNEEINTRFENWYWNASNFQMITTLLATSVILLDTIRFRREKKFPKLVWIVLGVAVLIFPLVNIILSWNMFMTPGVIALAFWGILLIFIG